MEISLRLPQMSDAEIILEWENNPENWAVSDNDSAYELGDIEDLIQSFYADSKPLQLRYLICSPTELLGAVDIFDINYENKSGAIGILIANSDGRRKGIGTIALALLEEKVAKMGLTKLIATMHQGNAGSRRLFEKAGYKRVERPEQEMNEQDLILVEKWINAN